MDSGRRQNIIITIISSSQITKFTQVLGALIASLSSFVAGGATGFCTISTFAMVNGEAGIKMTAEEASWIRE